MCDASGATRHDRTTPRPRWGQLYGVMALMLLAVGVVDVAAAPGVVRVVEGAVAVGGFVMALLWIRGNRVALGTLDWCSCASTTVRVVGASRTVSAPLPSVAGIPITVSARGTAVDELEEDLPIAVGILDGWSRGRHGS